MSQTSPSGDDQGETPVAREGFGQRARKAMTSWQGVLVALIGAAGTILAALLTSNGFDGSARPSPEDSSETRTPREEVAFTSTSVMPDPSHPPAIRVRFEGGRFHNLDEDRTIMAEVGPVEASGSKVTGWAVASAELNRKDGSWSLDLLVERPKHPLSYRVGTWRDLRQDCTGKDPCLFLHEKDAPPEVPVPLSREEGPTPPGDGGSGAGEFHPITPYKPLPTGSEIRTP